MLLRRDNTRYYAWAEIVNCEITDWGTTAKEVGEWELGMAALEEIIILGWEMEARLSRRGKSSFH